MNSDPEAPRTSSLSPGRGAGASQEGEGGSVRSARRAALQRQDLQRRCSDAWGRREADGRASSFPVCAPLTSLPCFTAQARTCRAVSTAPVRTGPLTLFPVSDLLIIFAFQYPQPLLDAVAPGVWTHPCVCAAHLHARVPLNAMDLPDISRHASFHRTPTHPPLPGERGPEASHPTSPGQTLLRILAVPGSAGEEKINIPGAKQHHPH